MLPAYMCVVSWVINVQLTSATSVHLLCGVYCAIVLLLHVAHCTSIALRCRLLSWHYAYQAILLQQHVVPACRSQAGW